MASGIDYRHIIADGVSEYVTADGKRRFLASDAELDDALKAQGLTRETQDIWLDRHGNEYRKDAGKSDEDWERQWASINQPLTKAPEGYVPRNYAYKVNQYALPDGQRVSVREDEEDGFAQWAGKTYGQESAPRRLARARVNGIDLLGDEPGISFVLNKAKEQDTGLTAEQMASLGVTQEVANAGVEAMAKEVERQNEKAKALGKAGFREATAVNQGIARFGDTSEHGFWATVAARAADTAGDAANLLTLGTTDVFRDMEQQITLYGNTETGLKNLQERSWLRRVTDASRASWGDMEFDTLFNMSDEEQHEWYKELARKLGEERHILEQRDTTLGAEAAEIGIGTAEAAINFAVATKTGALAGAALGSVIPGAGTAAGGAVGAAVGAAGAAASYVGQKFGAGRDRALQPKQTFNPMTGRMETYAPGMGEGRAVIAGVAQPLIEFGIERVGGKAIGRLTRKGRIAMAKRLLGRDRAIRYGFMPGVTSGRATNALDRGVERMTLAWRRFGAADTWVGKIAGMTGNVASRMTPSAIGEEVSEEILQSFIESGLNLSGEIVDANGELAGFSLRNGAIAAFETMKQAPELALGIALYGAGTGIAVRGTHALMDGYLTRNTMRNGLLWAGYTKEQLKGMKTEEMKRVFMERVGVHGEEAVAAARTRMAGLKIDELARAASDATGKDYSIIRRLRGEPTLRWLDGEGKAQEAVGEEAIRETLGGEIENAVRDTGLWAFTVGGRVNDITRAAMSANAKIVAETRRAIAEMGADTPFGGLGNSGEVYDALAQSLALRMMATNGAYAGTALGLFMKRQAGVFEAQALADAMELYGKRDALAFMGEYHTYFSGKSLRPVDGTAPDIFHERGEDGNGLEWEKVDGGRAMRSDGIYLRKEGLSGAYTVGAESGSGRPYATFGANEYDKARDYANRLLAAKRARDQRVATMRQRAEEMYDNLFGAPADGEPRGMEVIGSVWEDPEVAQEILTRMTTQEGMTEDEAADALSKITGARLADGRMVVFIDNINSVAELAAAIRHEGFHRGFEDMLDAEGDAEAFVRQAWALFDGDGLGIGTRMGADSRRMKGTQEEIEAAWAEMGDEERRVAVEETLASLAELLARKPGLGDRIARAVNGLFHKGDGVSGIDEARAIVNDAFMRVHGGKSRSAEEEEESRRAAQEWMDAFRKRMRERPAQRAGEQMAEGMREEAEAIASRSLPPPGDEGAAQKDYENRERGEADKRNEGKLERPSVYTTPVWTAREGESEDVVGQYIPYGTVFPNRDLPPGAWEALQAYRGMLAWWINETTRQGNARPPAQDGVSQPSVVPTDNKNAIAPSLDLSKVSVVDLLHGAEGTGVSDVPVNDIAVNERIVQFKRNADPKSGVVAGERLFGGWSKTMAHPIRVMLFKDGHMEVITGRHRLDLAKRLGMETIPAYVYREADGMTVEKAHALDGAENILDKRGTYQDHIRFFIDSGMTPEEMRRLGFSSKLSKTVDAAYQIATNAIDEVRTEALNHDVPNDPVYYNVLAAIASNDKRIQLALLNAMLHDKTEQLKRDPTAILAMGRALASNIPDDTMGDVDLFGNLEDPAIEESRLVGLGVASFVRELNGVATTLRNAVHSKGKLQLSKEWRDHLGLTGKKLSNDKLREVVNKIEEEIAAWQDVGLSGEMRQRALERGRELDAKAKGASGDATDGASPETPPVNVEPAPVQEPAPTEGTEPVHEPVPPRPTTALTPEGRLLREEPEPELPDDWRMKIKTKPKEDVFALIREIEKSGVPKELVPDLNVPVSQEYEAPNKWLYNNYNSTLSRIVYFANGTRLEIIYRADASEAQWVPDCLEYSYGSSLLKKVVVYYGENNGHLDNAQNSTEDEAYRDKDFPYSAVLVLEQKGGAFNDYRATFYADWARDGKGNVKDTNVKKIILPDELTAKTDFSLKKLVRHRRVGLSREVPHFAYEQLDSYRKSGRFGIKKDALVIVLWDDGNIYLYDKDADAVKTYPDVTTRTFETVPIEGVVVNMKESKLPEEYLQGLLDETLASGRSVVIANVDEYSYLFTPKGNPRGFAPDTYDWAMGVRKGKDVKASDFERTFGFEKARIGKSEYGQKIANAAYDALASLARAVNVPYEAISLGGILKNIDLGIRGANRNAAYVGGNTIVINKDLGLASAESVANARFSSAVHEWAHALDAALSLGKDAVGGAGHAQTKMSNRGSSLPFADEHTKPRVLSKDVRQEMVEAYRAVQGYIALLHAPEYASTAYETENAFYDGLDRMASGQKRRASPYPYKEEVEQLAPVLDAFFNSLRVGTNARTGKYTLYRRRQEGEEAEAWRDARFRRAQEWTDDGLRLRRAYDDAWNAWREIVKDFVRTGDYAGDEAMQWLQEGEENDKRAAAQRRKGIGKRFAMWLEESFINAQAPVFRFYRRVMDGRSLSEKDKDAGLNVEAQLKNEPGRIRERQERVRKDYVDKINALLREANISKGDFGLYLMALHGKEYNALVSARKTSRGKDGTPIPPKYVNPYTGEEMEPYGSGFTDTEWDAVIRTFETRPNYDSFKKAAELVRKMNDNALDTLVRAGNISEAQAKQWKDTFSHYVPMRDEDSIGGASGAFSRRVVGRELYHLPTANAYTASVFQAMAAEAMAERNETRKRVVEWFEKYGAKDTDVKFRVLDAPGEEKYLRMGAPIFVDINSPQYEELKNLGVRMVDAKYKGDVIGAFVWAGGGPRRGAKKGHLGVHVRNAISQGQNSAMFMDKGRRKFIVFNMPEARFMGRAGRAERYMRINNPAWEGVRIAEALNDSNKLRFDIPLVRDLTRFKARLSTSWNPNFIVATVPIDFINTANIMMLEGNYKALGKFLKNYKSAFLTVAQARLGKDASDPEMLAALKEALNHGMMTGTYASTYQGTGKDIERDITNLTADNATNLQKTRVALSRFVSKLDAATNVLEIATRLAAYKAMRDSGMSADEAAQYGREITVDFNANGNYTPVINTLYMFSNAAAQSFIRYVDAIRTGTQRRGGGVKGALNTILPVIALNVMIGFLAALWDDDEEEGEGGERTSAERNIPDYVWESGAPIRLPFMDHYLNIPMRGAMTPFMKFGRDLYRGMQGRAEPEEIVGSLIGGVMESSVNLFGQSPNLSQLVSPTFLDPFVQIMTEKDWTGRDLYRKDFGQAGSNAHAGLERTPAAYRGIAQGINTLTGGDEVESGMIDPHPETLKLLTDFFAGSLVGQLLSIPDTAKGIFTGDTNVNNVVGVGRFVRETPGISSRYYTELAKASETEKDYQKYIKLSEATRNADDRKRYVERAKELASENPWLRSRKSLAALARNITDMRTAVDKSSGERRERLRKEMERKMGTWVRVYERR